MTETYPYIAEFLSQSFCQFKTEFINEAIYLFELVFDSFSYFCILPLIKIYNIVYFQASMFYIKNTFKIKHAAQQYECQLITLMFAFQNTLFKNIKSPGVYTILLWNCTRFVSDLSVCFYVFISWWCVIIFLILLKSINFISGRWSAKYVSIKWPILSQSAILNSY